MKTLMLGFTKLLAAVLLATLIPACSQDQVQKPVLMSPVQKTEQLRKLCVDYRFADANAGTDQSKLPDVWEHFKAMIRFCVAYKAEVGETEMNAIVDETFGRGLSPKALLAGELPRSPRDEITVRTHQLIFLGEDVAFQYPHFYGYKDPRFFRDH